MPYKNTFNPALVILFCCAIGFFSNTLIQAQSAPKEKPQLKDFGSSLKPKKEKNKDKSESNIKKSKKVDDDTDDVIKIETRLVRTDVLVVDQRGKAILGLKASDFIITENNVPQEIGTFSLGENINVPKSIVLIIDYNCSIAHVIENSIKAAKILVSKLNPKDRMAIVTDDVELLIGFTNNKKLLNEKLDILEKRAKRAINQEWNAEFLTSFGKGLPFSALMATLNEMFDEEDIRPMIIFQSSGVEAFNIEPGKPEENKSVSTNKFKWGSTTFTIAELFNMIEKSRATIYSVITDYSMLGLSPDERIAKMSKIMTEKNNEFTAKYKALKFNFDNPELIKNYTERLFKQQTAMMIVARASGGFTDSLETPDQADEIYSRILTDINNRYLIGYYPENLARDGKRRNVKIEVRGHPEYIVWGRKTYLALEPEK